MQEQEHDSNFVSGLKIKTSAYITELIILNDIEWKVKKGILASKPISPFWRKNAQTTPELKTLAEKFRLELSYVKNLLHVFSAPVLIKYIKDRGIITIRFLTSDKQKAMVFNLFNDQVEFEKTKQEKKKNTFDDSNITVEDTRRPPKLRKGLV